MEYILLEDNYDTSHLLVGELEKHESVHIIYKDRICRHRILSYLVSVIISKKLAEYITMPFKKSIYRSIVSRCSRKCQGKEICLVMISAWYEKSLISVLKDSFPEYKRVLILRDTVKSNENRDKNFSIKQVKKEFDLILTYDQYHDAKQYSLTYAPVYMSKVDFIPKPIVKHDISLIINAKDRLSTINKISILFEKNNIDYFFYVIGAIKEERLNNTRVIYADKPLDRDLCLKEELSSNCILEVLKGDAHSNTLRYIEAIIYNKKYITNWKGVLESPYYDERYMAFYENIEEIDCSFIKDRIDVEYNYGGEFSPSRLLSIIENNL